MSHHRWSPFYAATHFTGWGSTAQSTQSLSTGNRKPEASDKSYLHVLGDFLVCSGDSVLRFVIRGVAQPAPGASVVPRFFFCSLDYSSLQCNLRVRSEVLKWIILQSLSAPCNRNLHIVPLKTVRPRLVVFVEAGYGLSPYVRAAFDCACHELDVPQIEEMLIDHASCITQYNATVEKHYQRWRRWRSRSWDSAAAAGSQRPRRRRESGRTTKA